MTILCAALGLAACVPAAPSASDGVFRARVTVDQATFGACAARALAAKYPGQVTTPAVEAGTVRILRTSPFASVAMDVRRAGRGSEVEVRPDTASGALWKDLSLCLPPI